VHLKGGSSSTFERANQLKQRLPRYYYEARTRYFFLRYGRIGLTLANILWHFGRMVSKGRETISGRSRHVPERQWRDIWTNWLHPLRPSSGGTRSAAVECSEPAEDR
jgi:N-acetylglucosaminyl-diphospho-decaprenol L-rhamnosyltransferase